MTDLAPGAVLGGYRIEEAIGHGGMGVVYRATQLRLRRTVAVKVIMPSLAGDPEFRERFERESLLAASIDHNHVVPIYEAGEVDGLLYIAMRYVEGRDLRTLIEQEGPLEPARAGRIMAQVASALDAAHSRGLVHRDVKPGNILVTGSGDAEHAYLTDFGLTKKTSDAGLTRTGQWVGTLDYAAPEQINNHPVDARTDVYALGCVLYQAVAGRVPYVRDSDVAKMYAHLHDPAPPVTEVRPDVPRAVDDVVARAMAKTPDERFPSAGDLGRAAVAAASGAQAPPERSVAAGAAAPGTTAPSPRPAAAPQPSSPTPPTQAEPQPRAPTPPTQAVPAYAAAPAPAPAASGGNRGLLLAILALLVVIAAGGAAFAAGVFDAGDPSEPPTERTPTAAPTEEATPEPAGSATPAATATASGAPTAVAEGFAYASYTGPAFQAQLPRGSGWSRPAQSEPTPGELYRTSLRGPGGLFLIIDYTPFEPARFGGDYISRERVGQTAFGTAVRYVFQGGSLPECQRTTCFDYLINDRATGGGFAVLAGGPDPGAAAVLARTVAESVVPLP